MLKLRFSKPIYKTYCDGKVTVCTYTCYKVEKKTGTIVCSFQVQGRSTCNSADVPDERTGRIIAESRAKYIAYRKMTMDNARLKELEGLMDELYDIIMFNHKMSNCKNRELAHLKKIIK